MKGACSRFGPFVLLLAVLCTLVLGPGSDQLLIYNPHESIEDTDPLGPRMSWNVDQIIAAYDGADVGAYARNGKLLLESQRLEPPAAASWPPGMPLLIAALVGVTGPDHYPLKLALISALAWALALFALINVAGARGRDRWLLTLTALTMFLLPGLRQWTFGVGSMMSESLSCAFFIGSFAAFAAAVFQRRWRAFILAGVLLGFAASFRSYFGPMSFALCGAPMLLFAWRGRKEIASCLRARSWSAMGRNLYLSSGFTVALIACQGMGTPYEIYKSVVLGSPVSAMTRVLFGSAWRLGNDDSYYFQRTDNTACKVDPALCVILAQHPGALRLGQTRNLAMMTMVTNPVRWYALKVRDLDFLWLGADLSTVWEKRPTLLIEGAAQILFGALGLLLLFGSARRDSSDGALALAVMVGAFLAANVVLFTFLQFEWRYSQPLRQLGFLLPFLAFAARSLSTNVSAQRATVSSKLIVA